MAAARLAVIANPFLSLNRISQVRSLRCNNGVSLSVSKRLFTCRALHNPQLHVKEQGQPETLDYRVFFLDSSGKTVSPWHDLPLHLGDGIFNFIAEIPKESSAKMEVATDEPYTPIKQDTKKGKLRYYPYNINWNYGLLPQTWEDPSLANSEVEGAFGDNDPVDVVEIGESQAKIGQILRVKPLGALAMIDEGELDWKIVAISLDDPRASLVNDVDDVEKHFPPSWSDYQPYRICDHVTVKWLFNQSFKSERGNFLNQRYLSHGIIWKGKTETRALLLQLETGLETIRSLMENQLTSSVWATRQQTRIMPSR